MPSKYGIIGLDGLLNSLPPRFCFIMEFLRLSE